MRTARNTKKTCVWFFPIWFMPVCFLISAAIIYLSISLNYQNKYLPNTVIGEFSVSGLTVDQVKTLINTNMDRYELTIRERNKEVETIKGREIDLHCIYDGTLEELLLRQNPLMWGIRRIKGEEYQQKFQISYNKEKLSSAIAALNCLNPELTTPPADAYLAYTEENGLQIIPHQLGNEPVPQLLTDEILDALSDLKSEISLEELGVYKNPEILEDSPSLLAQKEAFKDYAATTVTYRFGSQTEILTGETICQWLSKDKDGTVTIDQTKVKDYVKNLAKTYNTAYCAKSFKTSYGPTVTIGKGHYGWMIDQQAEAAALTELIESRNSQEREPIYRQTAASHDGADYGNTYVEMNLTAQHLFYYKDGTLLIESDFVSGNESKGFGTPDGAYELTYKQLNAVLKGKDYKTPVTYWMPFNGNIGMHDGYWRSSFGGTIYKNNGSHGCVNLPPTVASYIYEQITPGTPVLCYYLDGTETNKTSQFSKK